MRHLAEIVAPGCPGLTPGLVRGIFSIPDDAPMPEYAPHTVFVVDVTDHDPQPSHDWTYDSETGVFTAPPPISAPVLEPVEEISAGDRSEDSDG